jgi:hypothetical protein
MSASSVNIDDYISFSIDVASSPDLSKFALPNSVRQALNVNLKSLQSIESEKRMLQKYEEKNDNNNAKYKKIMEDKRTQILANQALAASRAREEERRRIEEEAAAAAEQKRLKEERDARAAEERIQQQTRSENMRLNLVTEFFHGYLNIPDIHHRVAQGEFNVSEQLCGAYLLKSRGNVPDACNMYKADFLRLKTLLRSKNSQIDDSQVLFYLDLADPTNNIVESALAQYESFNM